MNDLTIDQRIQLLHLAINILAPPSSKISYATKLSVSDVIEVTKDLEKYVAGRGLSGSRTQLQQ